MSTITVTDGAEKPERAKVDTPLESVVAGRPRAHSYRVSKLVAGATHFLGNDHPPVSPHASHAGYNVGLPASGAGLPRRADWSADPGHVDGRITGRNRGAVNESSAETRFRELGGQIVVRCTSGLLAADVLMYSWKASGSVPSLQVAGASGAFGQVLEVIITLPHSVTQ